MRKIILIIASVLFTLSMNAQKGKYAWAEKIAKRDTDQMAKGVGLSKKKYAKIQKLQLGRLKAFTDYKEENKNTEKNKDYWVGAKKVQESYWKKIKSTLGEEKFQKWKKYKAKIDKENKNNKGGGKKNKSSGKKNKSKRGIRRVK